SLETKCVSLRLAGHVDERRGAAVAGHDLKQIFGSVPDRAEIGDADGTITDSANDHPPDFVRVVGQSRDHDRILLVGTIDSSSSGRLVRALDRPGDLVYTNLIRNEARGIKLNADLPHASPLYLYSARVRESRETRTHDQVGEIPEDERISTGQLVL